jgi:dTDP-4-amino-4,6-dideoxygalactose transaminase
MRIPFKKTYYDEAEADCVKNALLGEDYTAAVKADLYPEYGDVFLTSSGSSAFELLFGALQFKAGSEVILPSFTFPSVANTALRYGLKPVFAEIDRDTKTLSLRGVLSQVTCRTCCVIPTHYGGSSVDLDALKAELGDVLLIEDAALSFGGRYKKRPLGTVGDAGVFSFHQTKNISSGEGGMLVLGRGLTQSLGDIVQRIYDNGTDKVDFQRGKVSQYTWRQTGMNVAMPNICAAVLHAQLKKSGEILEKQRRIYAFYLRELSELSALNGFALPYVPEYNEDNCHVFYLLFKDHEKRERVREALHARGIDAFFHYMPLHASPMGQALGSMSEDLLVTQNVSRGILRLPIYASMTQEECFAVVQALREALAV